MSKIGIIRCDAYSENCAGFHCFPAVQNRTGQFENYDALELIGFDTCGGCGRGKATKIVAIAKRLKEKGAEVIHLGNCIISSCPTKDIFIQAIQDEVGIEIVCKTH
ncbi:CGGC domain-containing protein [Thermodesulfobacteriota bacterium]